MPNQYVASDTRTGLQVQVTGTFPEAPDDRVRIARTTNLFTKLMGTILDTASDTEPSVDGVAESWDGDGSVEFSADDMPRGMNGFCDSYECGVKLREFEIGVRSTLSKRETLIILAHEMFHLKQFATGEMKDMAGFKVSKWRGEKIYRDDIEYWDMPWEIEAHGREKGLYYMFLSEHPELKKYFKRKKRRK